MVKLNLIFTARKRSWGKVIFLHQFFILFTGGVRGCSRGVWFFPGGMHGFFQGACMVFFWGGAWIGYDEIWSMSGRYASYWNVFLLVISLHEFFRNKFTCTNFPSTSFNPQCFSKLYVQFINMDSYKKRINCSYCQSVVG